MQTADVIIIGGGPAGSAAAHRLKSAGVDVLVLDKERFPRHKLCAGWITPQVLTDLQIDVGSYPHGFLTFNRLQVHLFGLRARLACVQHSVRRFEFDAWLLERSGAQFAQHEVRSIRSDGQTYSIDERFQCRYLIGAGGTACPVRRSLFGQARMRLRELQTVTLEIEFRHDWQDPDCHLWFFSNGLPGYSWYVPKAAGWLNVGVGAMAHRLHRRGRSIKDHWQAFASELARAGIRVSLFIEPALDAIDAAAEIGAPVVELHTGAWCNAVIAGDAETAVREFARIEAAAAHAEKCRIECHAGHGLDFETAKTVAALPQIVELNIGHILISEAVFIGLGAAVAKMRAAMDAGRAHLRHGGAD